MEENKAEEKQQEPPFELEKWKSDLELSQKKESKIDSLKVSFGKVNSQNIELFKLLNSLVIPVQYSPSFYIQTFMLYTKFTRLGSIPHFIFHLKIFFDQLAYFNDIMVGALAARQEMRKIKQTEEEKQANAQREENSLYILTLGVLKPYRRYRIASQLLQKLEKQAKKAKDIKSLYLHVWSINHAGIKFYEKHGFQVDETLENYYNDIEPKDAYVLVKYIQ